MIDELLSNRLQPCKDRRDENTSAHKIGLNVPRRHSLVLLLNVFPRYSIK